MSYIWAKYEGSHFLDHVPPLTRSRKKGALNNPGASLFTHSSHNDTFISHTDFNWVFFYLCCFGINLRYNLQARISYSDPGHFLSVFSVLRRENPPYHFVGDELWLRPWVVGNKFDIYEEFSLLFVRILKKEWCSKVVSVIICRFCLSCSQLNNSTASCTASILYKTQ